MSHVNNCGKTISGSGTTSVKALQHVLYVSGTARGPVSLGRVIEGRELQGKEVKVEAGHIL